MRRFFERSHPFRGVIQFRVFLRRGWPRWRCWSKVASHKDTLAIDHHYPFRSFVPLGRPKSWPLFFAGAKLLSINTSCLSSATFSLCSSWTKTYTIYIKPDAFLLPQPQSSPTGRHMGYRFGKSCHLAPVRNTQRIHSRTRRLSMADRPPLKLCLVFGGRGFRSFHCSSFMKRLYFANGHFPIA